MVLQTGPCENWETMCATLPDASTPGVNEAIAAATEVLYHRTKRQFGLCTETLRPCHTDCMSSYPWIPITGQGLYTTYPLPALIGGQWFNLTCGTCYSGCSCSSISEAQLPYPVYDVIEVRVDGTILDPSAYRIDDFHLLVRVDGSDWPRCNDLNLDDTEVGTWSVTAQYGQPVPELGKLAAGQLASEIYKACQGSSDCQIPGATVKQIQRQGVTKVFFDAETSFRNGRIGLYYPDLFIATYNPSSTGLASIYNIDGQRHRHVGTTGGS